MRWVGFWMGVVSYGLCGSVEASCVSVPAVNVPRYLRTAVAAELSGDAGSIELPSDGHGLQPGQSAIDDICYPTFDPTGVVTEAQMNTRYAADEVIRQAADAQAQQEAAALRNEVTLSATNDLCAAADFSTVSTKIQTVHNTLAAQIQSVETLAQAKTALGNLNDLYATGLAKIARCAWVANRQ